MFTKDDPKSEIAKRELIRHVEEHFADRERAMAIREQEYDRFRMVQDIVNSALVDAGLPETAKLVKSIVNGFYQGKNP